MHTHANINDEMLPISDTFSSLDRDTSVEHDVYLLNASGEVRYLEPIDAVIASSNVNSERIPGEVIMTGLTYKELPELVKIISAFWYYDEISDHFNNCNAQEVMEYHNQSNLENLEIYDYHHNIDSKVRRLVGLC